MAVNRLYAQNATTMPNLDVTPGAGAVGSAAKSGDPVVIGSIPGVLLGDAGSNGSGIIQRDGIFNLSVKGLNSGGSSTAIAEGDILYFTAADTPPLSGKTGVRFGYALKGVGSGATATIPVQIGY